MKHIVPILLIIILLLSACTKIDSNTAAPKRYQAEFLNLFDTVTMIVGYSDSEESFKAFSQEVYDRLEEYHKLYDIYNNYDGINNIKTINDKAGAEPVKVDEKIISLLLMAKNLYELTEGTVNVAFGAVLKIWHDYRNAGLDDPENAKLPPMEKLKEAQKHVSINNVIIDEESSTVFLSDPEMSLDVGAIAKGYATEQVARYFEATGTKSLLLSVGGNVRAIGNKLIPDSKGESRWTIGLQNPDKYSEQTELMKLSISGLSVVSSGSYERYYTVDGKEYNHIIDPVSLMPSDKYLDTTIIAADSGLCDALSTSLFVLPMEEGRKIIEGLEGVEALWVLPDGSIEYTDGFKAYIKE
jgi:thiamine biosynthesis lipoprotein